MRLGGHVRVPRGTVVDFVTVRSFRFHTVQQLGENPKLKPNDLQEDSLVENLVPNPIQAIIEIYGICWVATDLF
jgi:hypothetical protein